MIELRNKSKFRIWDHLEEALPKFTNIELSNLAALKQIPMTDLIWKLRDMLKVEIKDESWPMWVYIMINGGICILGGALIFLYLRYTKNKRTLDFETPGCCTRFILCGCRDRMDKGEPPDEVMSVSYTKGTEEVNILPDRDRSKRRGYVGLFPKAPLPKSTKGG